MATLHIQANTEVLGFYQKQKAEFHFQEKTDNEFLMFLLDTAVRVISIVQHLAPVIEAVSDASADANEDIADDENFESEFSTAAGSMEIDRINREVEDIIQLPPDPNPPLSQPAPKAIVQMTAQETQFSVPSQQPVTLPPVQQPAAQISLPTPPVPPQPVQPVVVPQQPAPQMPAAQIPASQPTAPLPTPSAVTPKYSASIPSSSVPVSLSVRDMPAASHPTSAPQSTSQPSTSTSSDVNTTTTAANRDTSSYNQFAPPPDEAEETTMSEFKAEAIPEVVTIKDEPMSSSDNSTLLPQETLHHLMSTLQSNEENIGVSNLVTTAQPSSLSSTFLDKTNNPLSMLTLSNTTSNINSLFPPGVSDNLPGSSRSGELKSLMDNKAGGSGSSNPSRRPRSKKKHGTNLQICEHCGKKVKGSPSNLRAHINGVHLKVRPFKCYFCDLTFTQNGNRKSHMRKEHNFLHNKNEPKINIDGEDLMAEVVTELIYQ